MTNHDNILTKVLFGKQMMSTSKKKRILNTSKYPNVKEYILRRYDDTVAYNEVLNRMKFNGPEHRPTCPVCGKPTPYKYQNIYHEFCSHDCAYKSKEVQSRKESVWMTKYGVTNPNKIKEVRDKIKQTNIEKYGSSTFLSSKQGKEWLMNRKSKLVENYKKSCIKKYGVSNFQQSEEYQKRKDEIREKAKQTNLERYGVSSYAKLDKWKENFKSHKDEIMQKCFETQKVNGTLGKSKIEKLMEDDLREAYPDLVFQYKSEEYPWKCDFYIPSENIYIELQGFWTHGNKPYEGTKEDLELIEEWKTHKSGYFDRAIEGWTKNDVKKREWATQHRLRWIEFFYYDKQVILDTISEYISSNNTEILSIY